MPPLTVERRWLGRARAMRGRALRRLAANRYSPNVPRALVAACAVGLVALTLTLGSLRHPTTAVSSLPQPPLFHTAVPPVAIAPPALPSPRHRVTARPHEVVAKKEAVRSAVVVHPEAATRTEPVQTPVEPKRTRPHLGKRPSPRPPSPKPNAPPVTTPPTTPVTPPPTTASPVESPPAPTPPASTMPVAAPPIVVETSTVETRPGNGWGDRNHVHTGPPDHAK